MKTAIRIKGLIFSVNIDKINFENIKDDEIIPFSISKIEDKNIIDYDFKEKTLAVYFRNQYIVCKVLKSSSLVYFDFIPEYGFKDSYKISNDHITQING